MPKHVNHDERRREILDATLRILASRGAGGLSFRSIASELGGSTTLVTRFFGSRSEILAELADSLVSDGIAEIAELEKDALSSTERLVVLLEWLVPSTERGILEERARIALLADRLAGDDIAPHLAFWEEHMRSLLRDHLQSLVRPDELEMRVEMLRVLANGLTLSAIEHPELWDRARLRAILRKGLADMGLDGTAGR